MVLSTILESGWSLPLPRIKQSPCTTANKIHIGKNIHENNSALCNDTFSMSNTPKISSIWLCLSKIPWSKEKYHWRNLTLSTMIITDCTETCYILNLKYCKSYIRLVEEKVATCWKEGLWGLTVRLHVVLLVFFPNDLDNFHSLDASFWMEKEN